MDQQMYSKLADKLNNTHHEIISKGRDFYDILVDDFQIAQHICREYGGIVYGSVSIQVTPNQLEDFTITWSEESAQSVITNLSKYGKIINYYERSTLTIRMLQERGHIESNRSGELVIDVRYNRRRRIRTTSQEDESSEEEHGREDTEQETNQQDSKVDDQQTTTDQPQPNNSDTQSTIKTNKDQIKSNQIKSNQIKSNQIKSNQIKSNQIKSNQLATPNHKKTTQIQQRKPPINQQHQLAIANHQQQLIIANHQPNHHK